MAADDTTPPSNTWGALLRRAQAQAAEGSASNPSSDGKVTLDSLLSQARARLSYVRQAQPHQVLGILDTASEPEIRAAYMALAKRWHPDQFIEYGNAELQQIAEQLFIHGQRAYKTLASRPKR